MNKYSELVERVIRGIEHGDWLPGEALPSLRQAALAHGISLNTARRAYYELERLGHIEAWPRSGYVVSRGAARLDDMLAAPLGAPFICPSLHDNRALTQAFIGALRQGPILSEPALAGLPALRRQIARIAHAEGWALHADEVLITCGGMEALSLAISAVTHGVSQPGIAVLLPAFPGLLGRLAEQGVRLWPIRLDANGVADLASLQAPLAAGRIQAIALMSVCAHPHGRHLPAAARASLLALARHHDIAIIEDDAYRWLAFDGSAPLPLKADDDDGRILLCGTFSKTLAPGHRVGWLVPGRHAERARRLKLAQTLASPLPSQLALAELLAGNRRLRPLESLRARLQQKVRGLEHMLRDHLPARHLTPADGGYFVWLQDLAAEGAELAASAQARGIQLAPGHWCQPDAAGRHCLRLNASHFDPATQGAALDWLCANLRTTALRAGENAPLR